MILSTAIVGYIIRDTGLQYSISSKHRQTERFAHTLKQTLIDMGKLLQPISSFKVTSEPVEIESTELPPKDIAEYLEDFDIFGEATVAKIAPPDHHIEMPEESYHRAKSSGFARVMRRQSSLSADQLRLFGQRIRGLAVPVIFPLVVRERNYQLRGFLIF